MTAAPRLGVFGRLAAAVLTHSRQVVWAVVALTLLSLLAATRLSVDPSILDLLPDGDPTTQAIRRINDEEGGTGLLTIAVSGGDDQTRREWTQALAADLRKVDGVSWVLYQLDEDLAVWLGMLQLSPDELNLIETRLRSALAMGPAAQNPLIASRLLSLGPLTQELNDPSSAQVLSSSAGIDRILVRPRGSAFDPTFARPLMAAVHQTIDAADPAASGLEIAWIGGPYRHAVEDLEAVLHDLTATIGFSLGLVLLFLAAAFRRFRAVVLILTPLIIGNIWTIGFAGAVVPHLNTFTSYFTAVLIGLGVDFGIHLYARYREERTHARDAQIAVIRAWDAAGPPCMTAAVTSAAGFSALWIARFQGFQQLGTLLAVGVLLCLAAELVLLPLFIVRFDRDIVRSATPPTPAKRQALRYRAAPVGMALTIILVLAGVTQLPKIQFEYDISELRPDGRAYADLDAQQRALARDSYTPLVVSYDDDATLAADHQRIQGRIDAGDEPLLKSILSVSTVLPPDQEERVASLQRIAELSKSDSLRYLPPPVQQNLQRIRESKPHVMSAEDLPYSIQQLVGANDGHHRMLLMADGNMWDIREMVKLKKAVAALLPDQVPAGEYLATALLFDLMQVDAPRIALLAMLLVFVASWVDLRSLVRAAVAIGALFSGMALSGAAMALLGLKLSMANFVGIPILMGIGVDVVIHLLHRIREEGPGGVGRALKTTGWAALMSALTTIISFSSLTLAQSQGVKGLGELIVLGLSVVVITAFVVVPIGWMTVWRDHKI